MLCQIVIVPQFQNFTWKCCFLLFSLAQDLAGTSKVLTVTLNSATQKEIKTSLDPAPRGDVLFDFCKAKNEEKLKKLDFSFGHVRNLFPISRAENFCSIF